MKVRIDADEWYPVYSVITNPEDVDFGDEVEVDADTIGRWRDAEGDFAQAQAEMSAAVAAARKAAK